MIRIVKIRRRSSWPTRISEIRDRFSTARQFRNIAEVFNPGMIYSTQFFLPCASQKIDTVLQSVQIRIDSDVCL